MEIITADRKMRELLSLTQTVAKSKATVLIQGESGTGKELIAQTIHNQSARGSKAFVAINCAAIPENLLESELFGYEKGAFTGANQNKIGKFELAHCGSLFLDEISEMDIKLQAKLLRVLQEGQIDPIGGKKTVTVDVRILSATNKNLQSLVRMGKFREDLFYRLNVVNITLPPLRNRVGDIQILAEHFIKKICQAKNTNIISTLSEDALELLKDYRWPGNVRELENVIERAIVTSPDSMIMPEALNLEIHEEQTSVLDVHLPTRPSNYAKVAHYVANNWKPGTTLEDIERDVIIEALTYHHGNRTHTAKALGISIRTLRNKISDYRKLGIEL
jgi:two-component system response regulator FlrC